MRERPSPTGRASWWSIGTVFAANIMFAAGLFAHALLYNFYLEALGLRESVLGNAAAALTLGGLLALIPAGLLVDRLGSRAAYGIAGLLLALGLAGGALATSALPIYGCALVAGLGTATWRVAMAPLLISQAPAGLRSRAFSWNVALLVGSGALWTALAGAAPAWIQARTGWNELAATRTGLLLGAAGSLLGLVVLTARRRHANGPPPAPGPNRLALPGVPALFGVLTVVIALWMLGSALVLPFFNLYFSRIHGMTVEAIGAWFAVAQLCAAAAVALNGELSLRVGALRALAILAFLFAPLLWGLAVTQLAGLALAIYVLQGVIPPATNALIDQLLMEHAPVQRRGAVSSWRNAATEASGFAGASSGGYLLEHGSFGSLLGVAGSVAMLGAIVLVPGFRRMLVGTSAGDAEGVLSAAGQSGAVE